MCALYAHICFGTHGASTVPWEPNDPSWLLVIKWWTGPRICLLLPLSYHTSVSEHLSYLLSTRHISLFSFTTLLWEDTDKKIVKRFINNNCFLKNNFNFFYRWTNTYRFVPWVYCVTLKLGVPVNSVTQVVSTVLNRWFFSPCLPSTLLHLVVPSVSCSHMHVHVYSMFSCHL